MYSSFKNSPKPLLSSVTLLINERVYVLTDREFERLRKVIWIFYYPLDCPVCDQGSECDLKTQAISFW